MSTPATASDRDLRTLADIVSKDRADRPAGEGLPPSLLADLMDQIRCDVISFEGFDSRRQDQVDKILDMGGDIMKVCVAAGGALSGEHGIGIEKKEFMDLVFNDADLDVMMQVKNVFNPRGLLNPSKIFPTRRSCTEIGRNTTTNTAEIGKRVEAVLLRGNGDR